MIVVSLSVFLATTCGCLRPSEKQKSSETFSNVLDVDFLHQGGTFWYQLRLNDTPVGSQKTTVLPQSGAESDSETLSTVTQEINIAIPQGKDRMNSRWVLTSNEKLDGTLVSASKEMEVMSKKEQAAFLIEGNSIEKTVKTIDQTSFKTTIEREVEKCAPNILMFSLWQKPMRVNEVRSFKYFDLMTENFIELKLAGVKVEAVRIYQKEMNLLRLEGNIVFPGGVSLSAVYWMDRSGNLAKYVIDQSGGTWEYTLCSLSELQNDSANTVSEPKQMLVHVRGKINDPAQTQQVRYRVQMTKTPNQTGMTLEQLLPQVPGQTVKILNPQTAEVCVTVQQPPLVASPGDDESRLYSPNDLAANPRIQSKHPLVIDMAEKAADGSLPIVEIAEKLRHHVYTNMKHTGQNNISSTSADVCFSMTGGDLEYAILLAALARVKEKIPSRLVLGLVYAETESEEPYMTFHIWNELYLNGSWINMDATRENGGKDASRIRLADSNLTTESIETFLSPILFAANNLQVEILESP